MAGVTEIFKFNKRKNCTWWRGRRALKGKEKNKNQKEKKNGAYKMPCLMQ